MTDSPTAGTYYPPSQLASLNLMIVENRTYPLRLDVDPYPRLYLPRAISHFPTLVTRLHEPHLACDVQLIFLVIARRRLRGAGPKVEMECCVVCGLREW